MKRYFLFIVMAVMIIFTLSSCGNSKKTDNSDKAGSGTEAQTQSSTADDSTVQQSSKKVNWKANLYFPDESFMYMMRETRSIEVEEGSKEPDIAEKARICFEELLKGPDSPELNATSVPKSTKLRSVALQDSTIVLDLSQEFEKDHIGGSAGMMATFAPIVLTLTELDGVDQVSFLIEGKTVGDFKGHESLDKPFKRETYEQYISK